MRRGGTTAVTWVSWWCTGSVVIGLNLAFGARSGFVHHILGILRCDDIMLNVTDSLLILLVVNLLNKC